MNTSDASMGNPSPFNPFNSFKFDFVDAQTTNLDAEIVKQLPFVPGLKEMVMLRQVHALEHATVWILSDSKNHPRLRGAARNFQADNELLGGLSTDRGFYLYGDVNISDLRRAVTLALHRLTNGEDNLAIHPRCGTNLSVAMLLTAGFAVGMHLLLPRGPIEQLIGLGIATTTAAEIAPEAGALVQKYVTTAIPFNLKVENVTLSRDIWGKEAYFVKVDWQDSHPPT